MLKKLLLLLLIGFGVWVYFALGQKHSPERSSPKAPRVEETRQESAFEGTSARSLFVPYWSMKGFDARDYDRLIYFGIAADSEGINKEEPGFANLSAFVDSNGAVGNYLTIRMLDDTETIKILENPLLQERIIQEAVSIAASHGFEGIVLDLELFALFDEEVPQRITNFTKDLYALAKSQEIKLAVAVYGDVFYRSRPYDVASLSENSDEIIIMAYDFHKSRGEPGPNFPRKKGEKYQYDFQTMLKDFRAVVSQEKLSVAYGMFGYDWTLGLQGKPLKAARARSLNEITQLFINGCEFIECRVTEDSVSAETKITYTDSDGRAHEVWFEDKESAKVKVEEARKRGIGSEVYWAAGYF